MLRLNVRWAKQEVRHYSEGKGVSELSLLKNIAYGIVWELSLVMI